MDLRDISEKLTEHFPEWSERISLLEFREAAGLGVAANDGRCIYYNDRLMSYLTPENQVFYMAQQLVHLQLNHAARGKGKDPALWKRASDAVVNAMLKSEGFSLPEKSTLMTVFPSRTSCLISGYIAGRIASLIFLATSSREEALIC